MTGSDIVSSARRQVSDSAVVRWDDTVVLRYLNEYRQILYAQHPAAFYVSSIITSAPADMTAVSNETGFIEAWRSSAVHFLCGRMLGEDSEDAANMSLSEEHYKMTGLKEV